MTTQVQQQMLVEWDPSKPIWADVNRYHPLVSAQAYAAASRCHLIGVKVSEGHFAGRGEADAVMAAEANGLIVVGYEYGTLDPDEFLALFPPAPGRIPCLDFEGASAMIDQAVAWIARVQAAYGRLPWFYAGQAWVRAGQPKGTPIAACPWWGVQYGPHLRLLDGVGELVAWQYSDGVAAPSGAPRMHLGVSGKCDMSVLLCSADKLLVMAGLKDEV